MLIPNKGDLLYSKCQGHIGLVIDRVDFTVDIRSLHCPHANKVSTHSIKDKHCQSSTILIGNIFNIELKIGHMLRVGTC